MKLTVGETLGIIRRQQGIKQGTLEKAVGMAKGRLSKIENHNADLTVRALEKICEELKTSPTEFFQIKGGI